MFIVFDAIDGAGKGRQREEMAKLLIKAGVEFKTAEFPVHNAFYETVIHPALQEETEMNGPSWVLSYLLDKTLEAPKIEPFVGSKDSIFLADGYFTTTIAYQSLLMNQVPLETLLRYAEEFKIPKPDFSIYLDVDPKIAYARKEIEEGHDEGLDMFEKSIEKQESLRQIFKKMADESIYTEWEQVDGNLRVEEVTDQIVEIFKKRNII